MDELAWELTASLALLTAALDVPEIDVAAEVIALAAQARTVVQSHLGLTITIVGDPPATLTTLQNGQQTDIRASLRIPLLARGIDGVGVDLILYAGQPGAFVDLAADLAWMTGCEPAEFDIDEHLHPPVPSGRAETLRATSLVNQAVGVLIGRGSTPAAAIRELDSYAASNAIARVDAASHMLAEVTLVVGGTTSP